MARASRVVIDGDVMYTPDPVRPGRSLAWAKGTRRTPMRVLAALDNLVPLVVTNQSTEGRRRQRDDQSSKRAPGSVTYRLERLVRVNLVDLLLRLLLRLLGLLRGCALILGNVDQ